MMRRSLATLPPTSWQRRRAHRQRHVTWSAVGCRNRRLPGQAPSASSARSRNRTSAARVYLSAAALSSCPRRCPVSEAASGSRSGLLHRWRPTCLRAFTWPPVGTPFTWLAVRRFRKMSLVRRPSSTALCAASPATPFCRCCRQPPLLFLNGLALSTRWTLPSTTGWRDCGLPWPIHFISPGRHLATTATAWSRCPWPASSSASARPSGPPSPACTQCAASGRPTRPTGWTQMLSLPPLASFSASSSGSQLTATSGCRTMLSRTGRAPIWGKLIPTGSASGCWPRCRWPLPTLCTR
uniref:Uncharacterized protein n=1 Tax=Macrostomum lignano TaxID=282301 RepID=A0A1I8I424_9PLAT